MNHLSWASFNLVTNNPYVIWTNPVGYPYTGQLFITSIGITEIQTRAPPKFNEEYCSQTRKSYFLVMMFPLSFKPTKLRITLKG